MDPRHPHRSAAISPKVYSVFCPLTFRITARSAIAKAYVEIAIRTKRQSTAIMIAVGLVEPVRVFFRYPRENAVSQGWR